MLGDGLSDLHDGGPLPQADVVGQGGGRRVQDAGHDGGGDVVNEDEVPHDLAVLVDRDGLSLLGQAGEEGDDAGVGVDEGLAGAIDVLKPIEHRGDAEGAAPGGHEVLLAELGGGVDIGRGCLDLG